MLPKKSLLQLCFHGQKRSSALKLFVYNLLLKYLKTVCFPNYVNIPLCNLVYIIIIFGKASFHSHSMCKHLPGLSKLSQILNHRHPSSILTTINIFRTLKQLYIGQNMTHFVVENDYMWRYVGKWGWRLRKC